MRGKEGDGGESAGSAMSFLLTRSKEIPGAAGAVDVAKQTVLEAVDAVGEDRRAAVLVEWRIRVDLPVNLVVRTQLKPLPPICVPACHGEAIR